MANFGEVPVKKAETFSLETPEEADTRLEEQHKSPKSVEDDMQEFVQSAEAQAAIDREKTHAVLEQIKDIPAINNDSESQQVTKKEELPIFISSDQAKQQGVMSKVGILMKRFLGRELSPEEESQRLHTLQNTFNETVEQGNFDKMLKIYGNLNNERFQKKISETQFLEYKGKVDDLTRRAVISGDGKTFEKILRFNMENMIDNGPSFSKEELELQDGERISPEISRVAIKHLSRIIESSFTDGMGIEGLNNYKARLERWVESGVVSREEVNELPIVKKIIKKDILDTAKLMFRKNSIIPDPNSRFESYLTAVSQTGVYSKEEAQSFVKL